MTLTPAYGRDYKSKKAVLIDFHANKDFVNATYGPYYGKHVNAEQIPTGARVTIRYDKLRKTAVFFKE